MRRKGNMSIDVKEIFWNTPFFTMDKNVSIIIPRYNIPSTVVRTIQWNKKKNRRCPSNHDVTGSIILINSN